MIIVMTGCGTHPVQEAKKTAVQADTEALVFKLVSEDTRKRIVDTYGVATVTV